MANFIIGNNHVYVGNFDKALEWANIEEDDLSRDVTPEEKNKLVAQIRERIKNYLQLDHVNFLFGTGSSIHLGAAGIQNIPLQVEKDIQETGSDTLKEDFKKHIKVLQKSIFEEYNPNTDVMFEDARKWKLISDGEFIRNYKEEEDADGNHYGEICLQLELLLNYLTSMLFQRESEKNVSESERLQKLVTALKKSLFSICDVHERETSAKDLKRIKEKGFKEEFKRNKYLFHEKFLKALMQRPLNLQRANIFTSNYDLAFEYAFDNLGIKYIDGFSGFHHRYFKPETFNYDIFYPGTTTAGKVQRIDVG